MNFWYSTKKLSKTKTFWDLSEDKAKVLQITLKTIVFSKFEHVQGAPLPKTG